MELTQLFNNIYHNKTVLITGHTGFKGSWLCLWLSKMGAKVVGYSLDAPTKPNHIELLKLGITSRIGDIRDIDNLNKVFNEFKPEIVFHLAAQSLVRVSYSNPIETYEINVIGTLKVFEACRRNNVKAIVNITSDKAYENKEQICGYKEDDPMGGYDPYSSSKGCSELLTSSYRNSYFNLKEYKHTHNTLLSSCRSGNVIGGGDWAKDRLLVDIVLSVVKGKKVSIRNPNATRPWQHVLEPLSGYLLVGQKLLAEKIDFAKGWNFGPSEKEILTVTQVLKTIKNYWNKMDYEISDNMQDLHEANLLKLDSTKANTLLKWNNIWDSNKMIQKTVNWYKEYYENSIIQTVNDLEEYILDAKNKEICWTKS